MNDPHPSPPGTTAGTGPLGIYFEHRGTVIMGELQVVEILMTRLKEQTIEKEYFKERRRSLITEQRVIDTLLGRPQSIPKKDRG